jgi:hypothetical protein
MMSAGMTDEDSDASREGVAVHWVSESMLRGEPVGDVAPNGVVITDEMIEAAEIYVAEVLSTVFTDQAPVVEEPVQMPQIHHDCWGTPDSWWWDQFHGILYLWDLKFGHRRVLADGNWQMAAYLIGILNKLFGVDGWHSREIRIVVRIVQPRCYDGLGPVQEWQLVATDLRGFVNMMNLACVKAMDPDTTVTSGRHCRDCLARHTCPSARDSAAAALDYSHSAVPHYLTPIGLEYELRMLESAEEKIKIRKESLEAEAEARIKRGEILPGLSMVPKYGNRKWLVDNNTLFSTGDLLGLDLREKPKPVSPSKADTLCKQNKIDVSVISDYYGSTPNGLKLVHDDGSRARRIFNKGEI